MPLTLSVVIPNYNDAATLPSVVDSVFQQSRRPDEVIICDDGSTDDSIAVMERLASTYPEIRILRNDKNRGVVYTCNRLVKESNSNFIVPVSANDTLMPGFFETSMKVLQEHPNAGLACGDLQVFDAKHNGRWEARKGWLSEPGYISPTDLADLSRKGLAKGVEPYCFGPTCVIRRDAYLEMGGYPEDVVFLVDWVNYQAVAYKYGVCFVPRIQAEFVIGTGGWGSRIEQAETRRAVYKQIVAKFCHEPFAGLLPLYARGRAFNYFAFYGFNQLSVISELIKENGFSKHHLSFIRMSLTDSFENGIRSAIRRVSTPPQFARIISTKAGVAYRAAFHAVRGSLLYSKDFVANKSYAAYAGAFAAFDRLRKRLKASGS